mgnify:CR=1 FL=1
MKKMFMGLMLLVGVTASTPSAAQYVIVPVNPYPPPVVIYRPPVCTYQNVFVGQQYVLVNTIFGPQYQLQNVYQWQLVCR